MVKPCKKQQIVDHIKSIGGISIRRACCLLGFNRSSYYYKATPIDDRPIIEKLEELAIKHPSYGFRKLRFILKNQGYPWNHKRIYRVYKQLKMNFKRKRKRRLPKRESIPLTLPNSINEVWSMDFMSDSLYHGRRFRTLNIMDDYNRELLWIEIGLSIGASSLVKILDCLIKERGKPQVIRVDNGVEFRSVAFTNWCFKHKIVIRYIQPGKPTQNAYIERFNRSYRSEVLDAYVFNTLKQVKELTFDWIQHYNYVRPHESLHQLAPMNYLKQNVKENQLYLQNKGLTLV